MQLGDFFQAANSLEERLRILEITRRRVSEAEWDELPPVVRKQVPPWLVELLARHALVGAVLEYRTFRGPGVKLLRFNDPATLATWMDDGSLMRQLLHFGYFPFASESDGSVWVVPAGSERGPVYLLELPEWDGGPPSPNNGLTFAASKLEYALASMAVSEASYYVDSSTPRLVLWYGEGAKGCDARDSHQAKSRGDTNNPRP